MPELNQQLHNQKKPSPGGVGTEFIEIQHPEFQRLADKMHAHLTNADAEIDRDVLYAFASACCSSLF